MSLQAAAGLIGPPEALSQNTFEGNDKFLENERAVI